MAQQTSKDQGGLDFLKSGGLLGGLGDFIRSNPEFSTGIGTGLLGVLGGMGGIESFGTGGQVMQGMFAQKAAQAAVMRAAQQQQFENQMALAKTRADIATSTGQLGVQKGQLGVSQEKQWAEEAKQLKLSPQEQVNYILAKRAGQSVNVAPESGVGGWLGRTTGKGGYIVQNVPQTSYAQNQGMLTR